MGLRVDGDLKFGQSTANNIFVNMNKSLSQIHGEKEFLMKHNIMNDCKDTKLNNLEE